MNARPIHSIVIAPASRSGGVKSLYTVCDALSALGRSSIFALSRPARLADWFDHDCRLFDGSYTPDLAIFPEVFQPPLGNVKWRVCFALGKHAPVKPNADLIVCKSPAIRNWARALCPDTPTTIIEPSIDLKLFADDGRRKYDRIAYMTRAGKFPETAEKLKANYGERVVEIHGRSEHEVAEILKDSKVFVWRGNDREGSPRPPKEALVAGCAVLGLHDDLHASLYTDFGFKFSDEDALVAAAGEFLTRPARPTRAGQARIRDVSEEKEDWRRLARRLVHGADA